MITNLPISHKLTDWSPQACDSNAGTEPSHIGGLVSSGELGSDFMTFVFTYFVLTFCRECFLHPSAAKWVWWGKYYKEVSNLSVLD